MAQLLLSQTVSNTYKEVSELVATVHSEKKRPKKKKSMKDLMEESFFHGASWIGYNFIA